jgi:hypothetical protein
MASRRKWATPASSTARSFGGLSNQRRERATWSVCLAALQLLADDAAASDASSAPQSSLSHQLDQLEGLMLPNTALTAQVLFNSICLLCHSCTETQHSSLCAKLLQETGAMAAALCSAVPAGRNSELLRSRVANYLVVQLYTLQKTVQLTAEQLTAVLALLLTSLQQCSSGSLLQRELVQAVAQVCAHHGESLTVLLDALVQVRLYIIYIYIYMYMCVYMYIVCDDKFTKCCMITLHSSLYYERTTQECSCKCAFARLHYYFNQLS